MLGGNGYSDGTTPGDCSELGVCNGGNAGLLFSNGSNGSGTSTSTAERSAKSTACERRTSSRRCPGEGPSSRPGEA